MTHPLPFGRHYSRLFSDNSTTSGPNLTHCGQSWGGCASTATGRFAREPRTTRNVSPPHGFSHGSQEELSMTRLLMSGVAVAALVAFGSMADAQQQQQPTYQTQQSQGGGGGASTDTSGGATGGGGANQVQEETQPGMTKQKSSEDTSTTKKKSSGTMQKQTEQTQGVNKKKKTQASEETKK